MAHKVFFAALAASIIALVPRVRAEAPLLEIPELASLVQSVSFSQPVSSHWRVEHTSAAGAEETSPAINAELVFDGSGKLLLRYRAGAPVDARLRVPGADYVTATDLEKMFLVTPHPEIGVTGSIVKHEPAELANAPWLGLWFWPFLLSVWSDDCTWRVGESKENLSWLVGESSSETVAIELDLTLRTVQQIFVCGNAGGFVNEYRYSAYDPADPFSRLPESGSHRRFFVTRRSHAIDEAEPYDEYLAVRFNCIEPYQASSKAIKLDSSLFPKGCRVIDSIARRTYFVGGSRIPPNRPTEVVEQAGGTPLAVSPGAGWMDRLSGFAIYAAAAFGIAAIVLWVRSQRTQVL